MDIKTRDRIVKNLVNNLIHENWVRICLNIDFWQKVGDWTFGYHTKRYILEYKWYVIGGFDRKHHIEGIDKKEFMKNVSTYLRIDELLSFPDQYTQASKYGIVPTTGS